MAHVAVKLEIEAQSARLYLTRLSLEKHLEGFHELWTSEEAVQWSTGAVKKTLEESRAWMGEVLPTEKTWDTDKFAIVLKAGAGEADGDGDGGMGEGRMIGLVGTNRWCEQGMETGYCVNRELWGKGYATEAFGCFLTYFWSLSERKDIKRLVAKTHPDNIASHRVLEKCGGKKGEVLKAAYGRFVDNGVKSDVWLWYFDRPGLELDATGKEVKSSSEV